MPGGAPDSAPVTAFETDGRPVGNTQGLWRGGRRVGLRKWRIGIGVVLVCVRRRAWHFLIAHDSHGRYYDQVEEAGMTAEIAVLNQSGVAIAADSAVTIEINGEYKVFQLANKVFTLSKYEPVGVMIFDSSTFMGIDWETIIKLYRNRLASGSSPHLRDYAADFLSYLTEATDLFEPVRQEDEFRARLRRLFRSIRKEFMDAANSAIEENGKIDDAEAKELLRSAVASKHQEFRSAERITHPDGTALGPEEVASVTTQCKGIIAEVRHEVFEDAPIDSAISKKLNELGVLFATRKLMMNPASGIVFAGYGRQDVFPNVYSYYVEMTMGSLLKHDPTHKLCIDKGQVAGIIPFAQSEMVFSFMEGVDPFYQKVIEKELSKRFDTYAEAVAQELFDDETQRRFVVDKLERANRKLVSEFRSDLERYRKSEYAMPVTRMVASLPKVELATMAETLVNLRSFKRHVSTEAETVGGPIDVALISRGDGFVWIKRKHYFDPGKNHHFFANYYREVYNG